MKVSSLLLSVALMSGVASADVLTLKPGTVEKQGVKISSGATTEAGAELATVGSGLRKKKVLIMPINVYIAQLMVGDSARHVKTNNGALASIDNQSTVAMHLTFLRDVPASNIKESFQSSLDANGVPANDADIAQFMRHVDAVGAAVDKGTLTILISKNADQTESLSLENKGPRGAVVKTMTGAKGLSHKLMSIWLGVPADDYLAELKTELLQ